MKHALIAVASVGILASTAWVVAANAQANINPNVYRGNTSGPYGAQAPWECHAGPGPKKRANRSIPDSHPRRGNGFQAASPAPKGAAPKQTARRQTRP